jgi:hypothetical protein
MAREPVRQRQRGRHRQQAVHGIICPAQNKMALTQEKTICAGLIHRPKRCRWPVKIRA